MCPTEALASLWQPTGMPAGALADVRLSGKDPVLPSSFLVGTAAQACIAAAGLGAAMIGRMRGLPRQQVSVDMRHAAIEYHSERWLLMDGKPLPEIHDSIAGTYPCGDGGWVRLHTNFPHHAMACCGCWVAPISGMRRTPLSSDGMHWS